MRKISVILFCLFIVSVLANCPRAVATTSPGDRVLTPVQSISLAYDVGGASLHVEADHPSNDLESNYVRMMTVSVNQVVVSTLYYNRQKTYEGFSDDVPLDAKMGDVISVELFCKGSGSRTKDLTVTKTEAPKSAGNANTDTTNTTIDNSVSQ